MKHRIFAILILVFITISAFSPVIIKAYTRPLYPLMFLGATWYTKDGGTPYPNTIATLMLYFTPRNDEGVEDLVVELSIPKPLSSENGENVVYLAHPKIVSKGETVELKTNIIVPANAKPGTYSFTAYVRYKIPIDKYIKEQRGSIFTFQLLLHEKPSLEVKSKLQKLKPDSINELEFYVFYNGSAPSTISVNVDSNDISILNYTPTVTHALPGQYFKIKVKAYVPPYNDLMKPLVSVNIRISAKYLDRETEVSRTFRYLVLDRRAPSIKLNIVETKYVNGVVTVKGTIENLGNKSVSNLTIEVSSNNSNVIFENNLINIGTLNPGERKSFEIKLKVIGLKNILLNFSTMFFSDKLYEIRKHYEISLPTDFSDPVKVSYEINSGESLKLGSMNTLILNVISNTRLKITSIIAELELPKEVGGRIIRSYSKTLSYGEEAKLNFNFYLPDTLPSTEHEVPITVKLTFIFENGLFLLNKTLYIPGKIVEKPVFLVSLETYGIKQAREQDLVFYVKNEGSVPTKVDISVNSDKLSILSINPQYVLLKPGEKVKVTAKVYCPILSENIETVTTDLKLKYKWRGTEEVVSKTFHIPLIREALLKVVEIQQTQSEDRIIVKGQFVNIGDAEAKYVTLTSKIIKGNASIENPTLYLGNLGSGEGANFFIYAKVLSGEEAKILLTIDYQQPNRTWSSVSKEITVHFKHVLKEASKTGLELSEIALPIIGIVASIVTIAVILIRYVRRK